PVQGTPGSTNPHKPIGRFYAQLAEDLGLCAYHIPGGSFSMRFTDSNVHFVDDGHGGQFLEGTFELTILAGTGIYKPFAGGHNPIAERLDSDRPARGCGSATAYSICSIRGKSATPSMPDALRWSKSQGGPIRSDSSSPLTTPPGRPVCCRSPGGRASSCWMTS